MSKFIRYSLYILLFFLPIVFFSLSTSPVAFDRQLFISIFILGSLILFGLGGLLGKQNKGKSVFFNRGWLSNAVYLFFIISILSFIFSKSRFQSFWGASGEPTTILNLVLYTATFFLFANVFLVKDEGEDEEKAEEKNIFNTLIAFLTGSALLSLLALTTLVPNKSSFIAKVYQLVGPSSLLALLSGGALVVLVSLISWGKLPLTIRQSLPSERKKKWKWIQILKPGFSWLILALSFFWLITVNSWFIWIGIASAMVIIVLSRLKFSSEDRKSLNFKSLSLPIIIFCLSLIFLFVRLPISSSKFIIPQVGPNFRLSSNIVSQTLKESPKNLFLGSGPATFAYQYDLYKPASVNSGTFWQNRFQQGSSSFLTLISNLGILGAASFLLIFLVFIWQGFKTLFGNKGSTRQKYLRVAIFSVILYFFFAFFFFPFNLLIWFYLFAFLALWEAMNGEENPSQVKTVSFLKSSPLVISSTILGLAVLASVSAIFLYETSQRYVNQLSFTRAISLYNKDNSKTNQSIDELKKILNHNPAPLYVRNLSQLYLLRLGQVGEDTNLSQQGKQKEIQTDLEKSQQLAQLACEIDPVDNLNWIQKGNVYENIIGFQGAGPIALDSYKQAQRLAPTNPNIALSLGRVNLTLAQQIKGVIDSEKKAKPKNEKRISQLEKSYDDYIKSAQESLQKAIQLKRNFALGYYWMGRLYELEGKKDLALQNYRTALYFQPENNQIQKQIQAKINELSGKSGK